MLIQLLVSLFGIASVYRILSLFEKTNLISSSKLKIFFYFLQFPFYFNLIFKELFVLVIIYIGIILTILILFDKIIDIFKEKSFELLHIYVIERIILLLKTGKSAQVSTKNVFDDFTSWQKSVFIGLIEIFDDKFLKMDQMSSANTSRARYFQELKTILCSTSHVVEQLKSYQRALRLQSHLLIRSKQATQQTKAQALVSLLIYASFIFLSHNYLKLELFSLTMLVSFILFCTGQVFIFRLGGKIRWKT